MNDAESICRAAYDPMHVKNGKIQNSFIKPRDLLNGQLSVWRVSSDAGVSISEAAIILSARGPDGNSLFCIKTVIAKVVRDLRINNHDGRVFSIIDDCTTDQDGGTHPAHAVIAICDDLQPRDLHQGSVRFEEIKNKLHTAFRADTAWSRPSQSGVGSVQS